MSGCIRESIGPGCELSERPRRAAPDAADGGARAHPARVPRPAARNDGARAGARRGARHAHGPAPRARIRHRATATAAEHAHAQHVPGRSRVVKNDARDGGDLFGERWLPDGARAPHAPREDFRVKLGGHRRARECGAPRTPAPRALDHEERGRRRQRRECKRQRCPTVSDSFRYGCANCSWSPSIKHASHACRYHKPQAPLHETEQSSRGRDVDSRQSRTTSAV